MNPVTLSVIGHAFAATAEEMGVNLYRSAHSTIVREVRDIATAILDPRGNTVAIANYIPQLLNAIDPAAAAIAEQYAFAELADGEAFVLNDPFHGGQHINDVLLFTPIRLDGRLLGVTCANVHHLDLGGGAAASNARATDVFQEGIVFPPMRIPLDAGWRTSPFGKFLGANVRAPRTVLADFDAQIAACRTGEARVRALARKYGADAIAEFMTDVQDYGERISRQAIGAIPDGEYRGEAFMEDDGTGAGPFYVRVAVRIAGSEMTIDFAGTDGQAKGFINVPWGSTLSSVRTTVVAILGVTHMLVNAGSMRPVHVTAPLGSLVNPRWPAATRARTSACYKIFDAINMALAPVLPKQVTAPGFDAQTGITFGQRAGGHTRILSEVLGAGNGALWCQDGADGMIMHLTNGHNTPVESVEIEFPFLEVLRYRLVPDSGGDGEYRGGLGMERAYRILADDVTFGLHSDRHRHGAPGLFGGGTGAPGACVLVRDGTARVLGSKVHEALRAGDRLVVRAGGGGGYGPAERRPAERLDKDTREGRQTRGGAVPDPTEGL
ncbi:MAG TPA: hydantoinase B/oxoprolinase family protein [bacterium]|nr:hydantoinase B/oxoprolinase family protein [bacterium]